VNPTRGKPQKWTQCRQDGRFGLLPVFHFHPVHDPPQQPGTLCVGPLIPDLTELAPRGSGSDGSRRERTIRKAMVEADPVNISRFPVTLWPKRCERVCSPLYAA
jgi:hypothetical protein